MNVSPLEWTLVALMMAAFTYPKKAWGLLWFLRFESEMLLVNAKLYIMQRKIYFEMVRHFAQHDIELPAFQFKPISWRNH